MFIASRLLGLWLCGCYAEELASDECWREVRRRCPGRQSLPDAVAVTYTGVFMGELTCAVPGTVRWEPNLPGVL